MKIYDITQELFSCNVYPGDMSPTYERVQRISQGDGYNLTTLQMNAHNGTHVDAPYHFFESGKTVDQLDLYKLVGEATIVNYEGDLDRDTVIKIMTTAKKRILFKGNTIVTLEAAKELVKQGIVLVGVESQTVGLEDAPKEVHLELLGAEVILLEGVVLSQVPEGDYLLNAVPLNLGGADGAPCRAILISER